MKAIKATLLATMMVTSLSSMASDGNISDVGFPAKLFSDRGCSESYYKKARKTNRIMGATLGGAAILASAAIPPLAVVMTIGGIGMVGDAAFDTAHGQWDDDVQKTFKIKPVDETYPRIIYPIARQFFDSLNTIEFASMLEQEENSDILDYTKVYIRATALAAQEKGKLNHVKLYLKSESCCTILELIKPFVLY